jgi:hypothetical protein
MTIAAEVKSASSSTSDDGPRPGNLMDINTDQSTRKGATDSPATLARSRDTPLLSAPDAEQDNAPPRSIESDATLQQPLSHAAGKGSESKDLYRLGMDLAIGEIHSTLVKHTASMQDPSHCRAFLRSIDDPDHAPKVSTDAPPPAAVHRTFSPEELESLQEGLAGEFATIAQELASEAKDQEPHDEATAGSDGGGKISLTAAGLIGNTLEMPKDENASFESMVVGAREMWPFDTNRDSGLVKMRNEKGHTYYVLVSYPSLIHIATMLNSDPCLLYRQCPARVSSLSSRRKNQTSPNVVKRTATSATQMMVTQSFLMPLWRLQ